MKSCFMFGHADSPEDILPKIESAVLSQYTIHDITVFYVGNRGRFDSLAATAVKHAKRIHPDIQLFLLLAYHPGEKAVELTEGFDGSFYPLLGNVPRRYAIVRANQHMVDTVDSLICFVKHVGNTRNLLEYAKRRQINDKIIIHNTATDTDY